MIHPVHPFRVVREVVAAALMDQRPRSRGRFAAITAMAAGRHVRADADCEACGEGEMAISASWRVRSVSREVWAVVGRLFGGYFGSNCHGGDDSEVARGLIEVLVILRAPLNQQDGGCGPEIQAFSQHGRIF